MNKITRNPKAALALSLLMPGLGQVYNGEASKGIALFLAYAFSVPLFPWLALHGPAPILWVVILIGVLFAVLLFVAGCVDAVKTARRIKDTFTPGPLNTPYVYLSLLFFGYFFVMHQLASHTQEHITASYYVPSNSMSPNLIPGDYFFADKHVNTPGSKREIRRGDIVVLVHPNNRTRIYVKRIIGLPGDRVVIDGNNVQVNGQSIVQSQTSGNSNGVELTDSKEPYTVIWSAKTPNTKTDTKVPNGRVFVLGDNRDEAEDSRQFGTVPLSDVVGIAKQVWLSKKGNTFHFNRIGTQIDLNS